MKTSFLILISIAFCVNQVWIVSAHICTKQSWAARKSDCIFHCIKIIYEEKQCSVCSTDEEKTFSLNDNETLASLQQYDWIFYNDTTKSFKSSTCSACGTDVTNIYERYFRPHVLKELFDCTQDVTVQLNVFDTKCTEDKVRELYTSVTARLNNPDKWCVDALDLSKQFFRYLRRIHPQTVESRPKIRNNANVETATDLAFESTDVFTTMSTRNADMETTFPSVFTNVSTEATTTVPTQTTQDHTMPTSIDVVANGTTTKATPHTTRDHSKPHSIANATTPEHTSPSSTVVFVVSNDTTTKPTPHAIVDHTSPVSVNKTANSAKPNQRHKSHFSISITIIFIVMIALVITLVILAIVLQMYVSRRKRFQSRTDSRTYVFDARD